MYTCCGLNLSHCGDKYPHLPLEHNLTNIANGCLFKFQNLDFYTNKDSKRYMRNHIYGPYQTILVRNSTTKMLSTKILKKAPLCTINKYISFFFRKVNIINSPRGLLNCLLSMLFGIWLVPYQQVLDLNLLG